MNVHTPFLIICTAVCVFVDFCPFIKLNLSYSNIGFSEFSDILNKLLNPSHLFETLVVGTNRHSSMSVRISEIQLNISKNSSVVLLFYLNESNDCSVCDDDCTHSCFIRM